MKGFLKDLIIKFIFENFICCYLFFKLSLWSLGFVGYYLK